MFIVQSFAAQMRGRGDIAGARRFALYGLVIALVAGAVAALAVPAIGPALGLAYHGRLHALMRQYMVIRLASVTAVVGTEALGAFYGGLGNTWMQMIAGAVAMAANVPLAWLMIHGGRGFPAMGVAGAAPELRKLHPEARTLSVFLPGLDGAESHDNGAVEWRTPTAKTPSGTALRVVPLDVPAAVFGPGPLAPDLQAVREALYRAPGFAGGGPLWVQDGESHPSPEFVLQCDGTLVPGVNLGDTGMLYVFESSIAWQSH